MIDIDDPDAGGYVSVWWRLVTIHTTERVTYRHLLAREQSRLAALTVAEQVIRGELTHLQFWLRQATLEQERGE